MRGFRRRRRPNWKALERAKLALVDEFSDAGVTTVEFVTAFSAPFPSTAWLVVDSDDQRDVLLRQYGHDSQSNTLIPELHERATRALSAGGVDAALLRGVTVESQETVDRDYEGKWFYALR